MTQHYYNFTRTEIASLLPKHASRVLDVGCGVGATSAWLKLRYPGSWTIGFEGNTSLQSELSRNVDEAHIVDLNGPLPMIDKVDLVLLLDVLEHLVSPERVLAAVVSLMEEGAIAIVSVPNVAHLSVSIPLLLRGRFDYQDAGILDRTHLHFYDSVSAIDLVRGAGLQVTRGLLSGFGGKKTRLIDGLTLGKARARLAKQLVLSGQLVPTAVQTRVNWTII